MTLQVVLWVLSGLLLLSEIVLNLLKRSKPGLADAHDRGSVGWIWVAVALGIGAAVGAEWFTFTRVHWPERTVQSVALVLMLVGLAIRWWAIITLGRFFTTDVAIQHQQPVIRTGPYRFVRHPSYSGELVVFLGIGVFMANWLSLIVLLTPIALAFLNRISIEERALLAALGAPYADYCSHTKRLIPGIL